MIVEVKQGKLKGAEEKSVLTGKSYCSFLGIPYAEPPIGDLRFRVGMSRSWIFSDISERNNDYSDTLDFRRG